MWKPTQPQPTRKLAVRTTVTAVALGLAAAALITTADASGGDPDQSVVRTDQGAVRGTVSAQARTFQGIPYAAPPTGKRRWEPPAPGPVWSGTADATTSGAACPQPGDNPVLGVQDSDEDCLFLNVTTPTGASVGTDRPVFVWLHGGHHTEGAASQFDAERLAIQGDMVVVTVNYRLGALGYLAHPDLQDTANLGLQDQQAALHWVRRNARAFGGDAGQVTLAGESAGARSICAQLAAPGAAHLFHRAVLQSGPCADTGETRTHKQALKDGVEVAERANCPTHKGGSAAECLRRIDAEALVAAQGAEPGAVEGDTPYGPVYGTPELPLKPQEALRRGDLHRMPILHGINRDEERLRVWGLELGKQQQEGPDARITERDYRQTVEAEFGAERAAQVLARYPSEAYDSPAVALATVLTDARWARPAWETHRLLSRHMPVHAFEFAERDTPWFKEVPEAGFPMGAFHMAEVPYLFDTTYAEELDDRGEGLSRKMIHAWAGFATEGDAGWPQFTARNSYVQGLEADGFARTDFAGDHRYRFWSALED